MEGGPSESLWIFWHGWNDLVKLKEKPSRKLTKVPWRGIILKRHFIFQPSIFGWYVSFQGGVIHLSEKKHVFFFSCQDFVSFVPHFTDKCLNVGMQGLLSWAELQRKQTNKKRIFLPSFFTGWFIGILDQPQSTAQGPLLGEGDCGPVGGSQFFWGFERKEIKRKVTTKDQVLALEMILGLYENHPQIRVVNLEHTKNLEHPI